MNAPAVFRDAAPQGATRPLRLAALTASLSRAGGGVSEALRSLSHAMRRTGRIEVHALGAVDEGFDEDRALWRGIDAAGAARFGPPSFAYAPGLSERLERIDPDVVHVHGLWTHQSIVALRWARATGRPVVVSPHGMLDVWALSRGRVKKRIAWLAFQGPLLRRAACIHALCEPEADAIRALGLPNEVSVAPNGVDVPEPVAQGPRPDWAAALAPGERALVFLGRIHPKKNLPALMRALARTPAAKAWRLVVAGWDQEGHEAQLRALAGDLGLAGSTIFAGPQFGPMRTATLRAADAFVLPSLSEGLPMAVLEAWACGLPVLMTGRCNLPEGVAAGAAVEADPDEASLAIGLDRLFALDDDARRAMGARGLRLVRTRFAWSAAASRFEDIYRRACAAGPAREGARP